METAEKILQAFNDFQREIRVTLKDVGDKCLLAERDIQHTVKSFEDHKKDNKDQHDDFYTGINSLDKRVTVMERVDDPTVVSSTTRYKVLWDIAKVLIAIGTALLIAKLTKLM